MELRHLRYFLAVGEQLHFGRAAAQLRIAQPSLSHQIRQLEGELQLTLLERTKRRVRLTDAGRLFLGEAREILAHADRATVAARQASVGQIGRLRVGFAHWMDVAGIVRTVKRFETGEAGVHVDLRSLSVPLQIAALRDGHLDVGFVRPPLDEPSLASEVLSAEPFVVALPERHRLAGRPRIAASALSQEAFILFPREAVPRFYDLTLKMCRDAGFVPHVRVHADQPQLLLELVAAGLGGSLVPASTGRARQPGVAFRPLRAAAPVLETAVAWRRDNVSPILRRFLDAVREWGAPAGRRPKAPALAG